MEGLAFLGLLLFIAVWGILNKKGILDKYVYKAKPSQSANSPSNKKMSQGRAYFSTGATHCEFCGARMASTEGVLGPMKRATHCRKCGQKQSWAE